MKKILTGSDARHAILRGMEALAEPVAATLGPQGRNAVIHIGWGQVPNSTRDGVTVAKSIDLADPVEDAGAQLLKNVAKRTAESAGDGTTTATVLAAYLCRAGIDAIDKGANPRQLAKEIETAAQAVSEELRKMARPVHGERIEQVATISANNDPVLGKLIAQAVRMAGSHGVITVEDSPALDTTVESAEGMRLPSGWKSPYFISDAARQEYRAEDCKVIIFEKKLGALKPGLHALFNHLAQFKTPLLILAEDIEGDVMATLAVNRTQNLIPWCAVRVPQGMSPEALADVAVLTGATVVNDALGLSDDTPPINCLGTAKMVRATKHHTTIIGYGRNSAIEERIDSIRTQLADTQDAIERDRFQERLAKLSGGISVLRVGAATEVELREKKARIEDAIHATRAAIEEGVLPGGGIALIRGGMVCPQTVGGRIVWQALSEPMRRILDNAGEVPAVVFGRLSDSGASESQLTNYALGWNALTATFCDLIDAGVIDPAKVTRTALLNAASLAAVVLLTETLIVDYDEAAMAAAQAR